MLPSRFNYSTVKLFDELFEDLFDSRIVTKSGIKTPVHDVIENDKEYIVEMLLAGVLKENISIDIEKDVLTIKAERKSVNDLKYNRKETYFGKYERSFVLPEDVDYDKITSALNDGVLKIVFPKLESKAVPTKKKIEIT
jgi:HSP20 family protein